MTIPTNYPAQRKLVHKLINWDWITSRLKRYPAIERAFPIAILEGHCESPPYYCHYMSWRLGTYHNESTFQRLEKLLRCAEKLPNWESEQNLLTTGEFTDFWSLVWQLQIAEYLYTVGSDVRWNKSGPDLSVQLGDKRLYVECYTPRKSFGLLKFIEELLTKLDPVVRTQYDLCLPFSLPQDTSRNKFLDKILNPFLDSSYLAKAKEDAKARYPVTLYRGLEDDHKNSLHIYVEGDDANAYVPGMLPNQVGDPKSYIELVLKEAINNKEGKNALGKHRPNLLAVNFLLSTDYQLACSLQERLRSLGLPDISPNIDALTVSVVGIDERLTKEKLIPVKPSEYALDEEN